MFLNGVGRMGNLNRGPSIDASNEVSVYLAKRFHSRRILVIDQRDTRMAHDGHVLKGSGRNDKS